MIGRQPDCYILEPQSSVHEMSFGSWSRLLEWLRSDTRWKCNACPCQNESFSGVQKPATGFFVNSLSVPNSFRDIPRQPLFETCHQLPSKLVIIGRFSVFVTCGKAR